VETADVRDEKVGRVARGEVAPRRIAIPAHDVGVIASANLRTDWKSWAKIATPVGVVVGSAGRSVVCASSK
jgi:hypothetical protein